jgi:hypothetical protein
MKKFIIRNNIKDHLIFFNNFIVKKETAENKESFHDDSKVIVDNNLNFHDDSESIIEDDSLLPKNKKINKKKNENE